MAVDSFSTSDAVYLGVSTAVRQHLWVTASTHASVLAPDFVCVNTVTLSHESVHASLWRAYLASISVLAIHSTYTMHAVYR